MKNFNPPNKISRTPQSKKDVETKVEIEVLEDTSDIVSPKTTFVENQKSAAEQKNQTYKIADERIMEMAKSLTDEEVAALASHKGLSIKEEINYTRHTFQVREDHLRKFQDYSVALGKKKKLIVSEAFEAFFKKHEDEFERIRKAKSLTF